MTTPYKANLSRLDEVEQSISKLNNIQDLPYYLALETEYEGILWDNKFWETRKPPTKLDITTERYKNYELTTHLYTKSYRFTTISVKPHSDNKFYSTTLYKVFGGDTVTKAKRIIDLVKPPTIQPHAYYYSD